MIERDPVRLRAMGIDLSVGEAVKHRFGVGSDDADLMVHRALRKLGLDLDMPVSELRDALAIAERVKGFDPDSIGMPDRLTVRALLALFTRDAHQPNHTKTGRLNQQ